MEVIFWGVRGSYPVPGPQTVRYGGHTSCVEVRNQQGDCLIVDAGTGLRGLGKKLVAEGQASGRRRYNMILSHVHWDHIQGLPFFRTRLSKRRRDCHLRAARGRGRTAQRDWGHHSSRVFSGTPRRSAGQLFVSRNCSGK